MLLFKALISVGICCKPTRLVLCSVKFSCNCQDCVLHTAYYGSVGFRVGQNVDTGQIHLLRMGQRNCFCSIRNIERFKVCQHCRHCQRCRWCVPQVDQGRLGMYIRQHNNNTTTQQHNNTTSLQRIYISVIPQPLEVPPFLQSTTARIPPNILCNRNKESERNDTLSMAKPRLACLMLKGSSNQSTLHGCKCKYVDF